MKVQKKSTISKESLVQTNRNGGRCTYFQCYQNADLTMEQALFLTFVDDIVVDMVRYV